MEKVSLSSLRVPIRRTIPQRNVCVRHLRLRGKNCMYIMHCCNVVLTPYMHPRTTYMPLVVCVCVYALTNILKIKSQFLYTL